MVRKGYTIKPGANLQEADLQGADLRRANLQEANLRGANLQGADLHGAYLQEANLRGANLRWADLRWANLRGADLRWADLRRADLRWADLQEADLQEANLQEANLQGAQLPAFSIVPELGAFFGWKKTTTGVCLVKVPESAKRLNAIGSRKIRVDTFEIVSGEGCGGTGTHYREFIYEQGKTYTCSLPFNDDVRADCASGLYLFLTKQEAEDWG